MAAYAGKAMQDAELQAHITEALEARKSDPKFKIATLLENHKSNIASLKESCAEELAQPSVPPSVPYDDIFLLRFLVSRETDEDQDQSDILTKSAENVKAAIKYRKENEAWIMAATKREIHEHDAIMKKLSIGGLYKSTRVGEPVYYVRAGISNPKKLMNTLSVDDVMAFLNYQKEIAFQQCDKNTRESGLLTKQISVIDLRGSSMFNNDKRFFKCLGDSSKISEVVYPQLQGITAVINLPTFFKLLYRLFSGLMPKKFLEKQRVCLGTPSEKARNTASISKCPFAQLWLNEDDVPDFVGGTDKNHNILKP